MDDINHKYLLFFFSILLSLFAWLNSGSLSTYALILETPNVTECGYLTNYDDKQFFKTFQFLDGEKLNNHTSVLRRILYPLIAYPLMKVFKILNYKLFFYYGGFFTNIFLYVLILFFLTKKIQKLEVIQKITILTLFITYPGIYYYIGLPYSYNLIIPSYICLYFLLEKIKNIKTYSELTVHSFCVGLFFLGYDLWAIFLPASLILVFLNKNLNRLLSLLIYSLGAILPLCSFLFFLKDYFSNAFVDSHSSIMSIILSAYLDFFNRLDNYALILRDSIYIFCHNVLFSTFFFLSVLFLFLIVKYRDVIKLNTTEKAILASIAFLFCCNNFAPDYDTMWQMRGTWIARLYQPLFLVFFFYIARVIKIINSKYIIFFTFLCSFFNLMIVLGPIFDFKFSNHIFHNFYWQTRVHNIYENTQIWGKRPLGFCLEDKKYIQENFKMQRLNYSNNRKKNMSNNRYSNFSWEKVKKPIIMKFEYSYPKK